MKTNLTKTATLALAQGFKARRLVCLAVAFALLVCAALSAYNTHASSPQKTHLYYLGVSDVNDFVVKTEKGQKLEQKYRPKGNTTTTKSGVYKHESEEGTDGLSVYKVKCSELTYYAKSNYVRFGVWHDLIEGKNISKAKYWYVDKSLEKRFAVYGNTNRYKLFLLLGFKFKYYVNVKGRLLGDKKRVLFSERKNKGLDVKNAAGKINIEVYSWKTESEDEAAFKSFRNIIFPTSKTVTVRNVRIGKGQVPKIKGAIVVPRKAYEKRVSKLKAVNLKRSKTIAVYFAPLKGADSYKVYRKQAGKKGFKKVATLKGRYNTGFEDLSALPKKTYKYKVKAFDGKKRKGKASKVVKVVKK
jgi:hypothetical protein